VNTLNKQSWGADKWWSSSLGVERRANNSSPQKSNLLRKKYIKHEIMYMTMDKAQKKQQF